MGIMNNRVNNRATGFYYNLTQIEVQGLNKQYNLADGHAYHAMPASLQPVIQDMLGIWEYAGSKPIPLIEEQFKLATAELIGSPTLARLNTYSISPTASNSIDIVGAWLNMRNRKVGLLEPVFDNLHLLLKRRGVKPVIIQERDLVDLEKLQTKINLYKLDSLFIVTPNNPTGFELNEQELKDLCDLCAKNKVALFVDTTFGLYSKQRIDNYKILEESGVDYAVIEDTGKTFPTQDMKASLMVYSRPLASDMRMLYEEIFLCSSSFTLALLGKLLQKTHEVGLDKVVWDEVAVRRQHLERALAESPLKLTGKSNACALPLAWLDSSATGLPDTMLVTELMKHQVAVLPGRFFYRGSRYKDATHVRLSLMKPDNIFYGGVKALGQALPKIIREVFGELQPRPYPGADERIRSSEGPSRGHLCPQDSFSRRKNGD